MAYSFFQPGDQRAAKVKELFTTIAPRYDLANDLQSFGLHRYWKWRAVRLASPQPGARALDLCCGTADLARRLARSGASVIGLDFNERMLEFATAGREDLCFIRGDAQRLPFADNAFDIVTVGYGLRNLASWQDGLGEMARVAKPGGRLVVLEFGKPAGAVWRGVYFGYLRLFVPWLGRIFHGNARAYAYILESLEHYPAQQGVAAEMVKLGLAKVRIVELLGGAMSLNYAVKGP